MWRKVSSVGPSVLPGWVTSGGMNCARPTTAFRGPVVHPMKPHDDQPTQLGVRDFPAPATCAPAGGLHQHLDLAPDLVVAAHGPGVVARVQTALDLPPAQFLHQILRNLDAQIPPSPAPHQARVFCHGFHPPSVAVRWSYREQKPKLFQQVIEEPTILKMLASPRGDVPLTSKCQDFCGFPANQSIESVPALCTSHQLSAI